MSHLGYLASINRNPRILGQLGGMRLVLQQNFTFHGSLSAAEKQWFRREARDQAYDAFAEVIDAVA